jgi:hypothetical protein
MPEPNGELDPGAVWRNQTRPDSPIDVRQFVTQRTRELHAATRYEILASFAAAIFFVAIVAWRVRFTAAFGLVFAWILASLYQFRRRIWPSPVPADALAASCLDYYRKELADRRDHLRNEWIWHGPLLLACLIFIVEFAGHAFFSYSRLWALTPLLVLLVAWVGYGVWRRRREAAALHRAMDELKP